MGKTKYATHSAEFRAEAIRVARESTEPLARIAREMGVKDSTLRMWVKAARVDEDPPLQETERAELQRLRQQVRTLRMEREILKKAAAFFAKHSG
jgi:transposase